MAIREIRKKGDEILNKVSKQVKNIDLRIHELVKDMIDTMKEADGIGIAAPQVGILKRICIIQIKEDENPRIMINPEIIEHSGSQINFEGCLSIPGYRGKVERYAKCKVRYTDLEGKEVLEEGEELLARAFQHEIDHLDGILYDQKAIEIEVIK